jgi:hypothetical protein
MALAHFSLDFIAYETVPVCTYCWETNSMVLATYMQCRNQPFKRDMKNFQSIEQIFHSCHSF